MSTYTIFEITLIIILGITAFFMLGWYTAYHYYFRPTKITISLTPSIGLHDVINIKNVQYKVLEVDHCNQATTLTVTKI